MENIIENNMNTNINMEENINNNTSQIAITNEEILVKEILDKEIIDKEIIDEKTLEEIRKEKRKIYNKEYNVKRKQLLNQLKKGEITSEEYNKIIEEEKQKKHEQSIIKSAKTRNILAMQYYKETHPNYTGKVGRPKKYNY